MLLPLLVASLLLPALPAGARAAVEWSETGECRLPAWIVDLEPAMTPAEIARHVGFLAHPRMLGRLAGTPEDEIAARYIAAQFQWLGLAPGGADGAWEQRFSFVRVAQNGDEAVLTRCESRNVLGWLAGADPEAGAEYMLIGAHYDHLGEEPAGVVHPGADDNASGIAGLFAIAKGAIAARPRRSILFVAFGAEETGLVGSRRYLAAPARPLHRLVAMLNLDMIGRARFLDMPAAAVLKRPLGIGPGPGLGLFGAPPGSRLHGIARAACRLDRLPAYAPDDFPLLKPLILRATEGREDSYPFRQAGIPTLFLSTGESADYHRPGDTIDKVDPEMILRASRAALRTVMALDSLDGAGERLAL